MDKKEEHSPHGVGESDQRRGEDASKGNKEGGRQDTGTKGESKRPTGKSDQRDKTGVDSQDPIDPESPNLIGP